MSRVSRSISPEGGSFGSIRILWESIGEELRECKQVKSTLKAQKGAAELFMKIAEEKQFPDFWFFGRSRIGVWRSQETGFAEKVT
jgi:hypothetical protein